jgi:hypothetical protein
MQTEQINKLIKKKFGRPDHQNEKMENNDKQKRKFQIN